MIFIEKFTNHIDTNRGLWFSQSLVKLTIKKKHNGEMDILVAVYVEHGQFTLLTTVFTSVVMCSFLMLPHSDVVMGFVSTPVLFCLLMALRYIFSVCVGEEGGTWRHRHVQPAVILYYFFQTLLIIHLAGCRWQEGLTTRRNSLLVGSDSFI